MRFIAIVLLTLLPLCLCQDTALGQRFRGARIANTPSRISPHRVAPVVSENFVVYADDRQLANKVSRAAERYRDQLAKEWLGHELPAWRDKCPIQVQIGPHAGGETSFAFIRNRAGDSFPVDWQMKIFGPPNRLLDAVLPHEVTHTIFATHFGQPLPRWADEGACTTVEHESERAKNHKMLIEFLSQKPSRGIAFNRMFTMRQYPHDILPLYAQGYSLAKFLIQKEGKRYFLDYVAKGMANEKRMQLLTAWDRATHECYGFKDLSDLQLEWMEWVKLGCPNKLAAKPEAKTDIQSLLTAEPKSESIRGTYASFIESAPEVGLQSGENKPGQKSVDRPTSSGSWYQRQMKLGANTPQSNVDPITTRKITPPSDQSSVPPTSEPAQPVRDSRLPASLQPQPRTIWR